MGYERRWDHERLERQEGWGLRRFGAGRVPCSAAFDRAWSRNVTGRAGALDPNGMDPGVLVLPSSSARSGAAAADDAGSGGLGRLQGANDLRAGGDAAVSPLGADLRAERRSAEPSGSATAG